MKDVKVTVVFAKGAEPEPPADKPIGLGDAVAMVAQPIAGVIDAILGTNVKGCGGCKARQEALNKLVPKVGL